MSQYFGVIGNRDFIKVDGVCRPFWEFLDRQPDGWLTSLVYRLKKEQLPQDRWMLFDCGAWSYRLLDGPKIGKHDLTATKALEFYEEMASPNDFLVAPDHMILDRADADVRRSWNKKTADEFLHICPQKYVPMAVIHGNTIDERLEHADALMRSGYQAFAIGGIAARAAQKKVAIATVAAVLFSLLC